MVGSNSRGRAAFGVEAGFLALRRRPAGRRDRPPTPSTLETARPPHTVAPFALLSPPFTLNALR